jgi:hypothetical protein
LGPKCYILQYIAKDNKLGFKIRARSLKGEFLNMKDFEDSLLQTRKIKQKMEIMKKTGGKERSLKGQSHQPFSIVKTLLKRNLTNQQWEGRIFLSVYKSVPKGFTGRV